MTIPIRHSENVRDYPPAEGMPFFSYGFGAPITVWKPIVMQHDRGYHIELRVDTKVICQSGESEKRFVIRLPDRDPQLPNAEDVTFTPLEEEKSNSSRL